MNSFKGILRLSLGDLLAKALNFFAFIHLARVLGPESYGVLEFALSTLTYVLLLGDGGLELWATREVARGGDVRRIVARVLPLKLILTVSSLAITLAVLPAFPDHPQLRGVLALFCLTLFSQAVNLKWVFLGQERMTKVGVGLVIGQVVFAAGALASVHSAGTVTLVPLIRLVGDGAAVVYFFWLFVRSHGRPALEWRRGGAGELLKPALVMGASHALAFMSYNFDSVLLGFLLGPAAVGLYGAAYKPITVALALPTTYFIGLFPVLSRSFRENRGEFEQVVNWSLRMSAAIALPIVVVGTFLAGPIIELIFGSAYSGASPVLMVLCWSAALVIMRGTGRQGLNAAGLPKLDLRCAVASVSLNVVLNILLIPRYGITGAAIATLAAELLWVSLALYFLSSRVMQIHPLTILAQPLAAAAMLAGFFLLAKSGFFLIDALIGVVVYVSTLLWLSRSEVREWLQGRRTNSVAHPPQECIEAAASILTRGRTLD